MEKQYGVKKKKKDSGFFNIDLTSTLSHLPSTALIAILKLFYPGINIHLTNLDNFNFLKEKEMEAHYYVLRSEEEKNQLLS
jgi:hypothetical protein